MADTNRDTKYIDTNDLAPGMILAMDIISKHGSELIAKGSVLCQNTIEKLQNLDYEEILVYELKKDQNDIKSYIETGYDEDTKKIKKLLQDVGDGQALDLDSLKEVTSSISKQAYGSLPLEILESSFDENDYLYAHSLNVALLASLLGKWVGLNESSVALLAKAGLLHDIGKTKISKEILDKPGPLTDEEFLIAKKHSEYGYEILRQIPDMERDVVLGVLMHHEREDGTGYPLGIGTDKICSFGKILAITNSYAARVSQRPYAEKECPFTVLDYLENESYAEYDIVYLRTFIYNIASSYTSNTVILSNGEKADIVLVSNKEFISRPMVKTGERFIDLAKEKDIKIVEVLPLF